MKPEKFVFDNYPDHIFIQKRTISRQQPRHEHQFYEALFIISGERDFFVGDRIYHANAGDFLLINPHTLHTALVSENYNCECILLYFEEETIRDINKKNSLSPLLQQEKVFLRLSLREREEIANLLKHSLHEIAEKKHGYQEMVHSSLTKIFIKLTRFYLSQTEEETSPGSHKEEKVLSIIHYIKKNYHRKIDLRETADNFYISPPYLSRIFKEITNYNFVEYINCLRVAEAQKKLRKTDHKIIDIASEVGFGSVTHFGRVFKEITGHQPRYYRKAIKH